MALVTAAVAARGEANGSSNFARSTLLPMPREIPPMLASADWVAVKLKILSIPTTANATIKAMTRIIDLIDIASPFAINPKQL